MYDGVLVSVETIPTLGRRAGFGQRKKTHPLRSQKRHPRNDPTPLTSPQRESLLNLQPIQDLQRHNSRVPGREMLRRTARGAVAERLDCEQVDGVGQALARELFLVEGHGRAHGVDEHACWLPRVEVLRERVACLDAA